MAEDSCSEPNVDRLLSEAKQLANAGQYESALEKCNAAIAACPDGVECYVQRGFIYESLREYEKSLADAETVMRMKPEEPGPVFVHGERSLELGRASQALSDFDRVLAIEEESGDQYFSNGARLLRALCLVRMKRYADARKACALVRDGTRWFVLGSLYTKERVLALAGRG